MNGRRIKVLSWTGIIAPFWLLIGVLITALYYPDYSHINQVLSELGATGSPTQKLSPLINNLPLSILFLCFGFSICSLYKNSKAAVISGMLIIVHGLGTAVAGYFPCDIGCRIEQPSLSQSIHSAAGAVMFLSLTIANAIWAIQAKTLTNKKWFHLFSIICLITSLIFIPFMFNQDGSGIGMYQRLNYGIALVWLMALAIVSKSNVHQA